MANTALTQKAISGTPIVTVMPAVTLQKPTPTRVPTQSPAATATPAFSEPAALPYTAAPAQPTGTPALGGQVLQPTEMVEPTATPVLTVTPVATETPVPTATPTAFATATVIPAEPPVNPPRGPSLLWLIIPALLLVLAAGAVLLLKRSRAAKPTERGMESRRGLASTEPAMDEDLAQTEPILESSAIQIGTAQHIGTREEQEDALCYSEYRDPALVAGRGVLAAVADGVGGMSDGQLASTTAARGLLGGFTRMDAAEDPAQRLLKLVIGAHRDVLALNQSKSEPCGSTLVAALVVGKMLYFASVGDSRILLYRAGGLLQLNREQVLGAEADVQAALGQRPAEELSERRRKAITGFLGKEGLKLMDRNVRPIPLVAGDRVLLLSDGVFGTLSEAEIINAQRLEPAAAANEIVRRVESHQRAHQDNATVVIVAYNGGE
ncbi:MAG TPA: protein phosphatase 2C domain-containing protein [Candidatus Limiplasma sp.]|nr:protein phosphatase 2C domain-containing protein [Candidatus Limiplasma sp.]